MAARRLGGESAASWDLRPRPRAESASITMLSWHAPFLQHHTQLLLRPGGTGSGMME